MTGGADVTFGGYMITYLRAAISSSTDPYVQSTLGFAYIKNEAHVLSIKRLLAPLKPIMWFAILTILFLSTFVILLTKKMTRKWRHFYIGGRMNRSPILNMWLSVLGKSIPNQRIANGQNFSNFARTLAILWMLMWLVIRSSYEGQLYTYLQRIRFEQDYDTVEKVKASNCKVLTETSKFFFLKDIIDNSR